MIRIDNPLRTELLRTTRFLTVSYENPQEALQKYGALPDSIRARMAQAYKAGFGGEPWKEVCECPNCGAFSSDTSCRTDGCGTKNLPEAYPVERLIKKDFPEMITSFNPGVLVIAQSDMNSAMGFCAGGMTTIDELVEKKWKSNRQIRDSIVSESGVRPNQPFFYENEMVVGPKYQGCKIGSRLNQQRLDWITNRGIDVVLGRSINDDLIAMKQNQMPERGYSVLVFIPKGDTYAVDGARRRCYVAQRN